MIRIFKTWSEDTREAIEYLKYNNYGNIIIRILKTDYYICISTNKENTIYCKDVNPIRVRVPKTY